MNKLKVVGSLKVIENQTIRFEIIKEIRDIINNNLEWIDVKLIENGYIDLTIGGQFKSIPLSSSYPQPCYRCKICDMGCAAGIE